MRYQGFIVELYGDYGWQNAVSWVTKGYPDEDVIFRRKSEAEKCLKKFKSNDTDGTDYRIVTTFQLH